MKRTLRGLTLLLGATLYLGGLCLLTGSPLTSLTSVVGGSVAFLFGSAFTTAALV